MDSVGKHSSTSVSLLRRIQHGRDSENAWEEFIGRYGPKVFRWCQKYDLQDADARDVTQAILVKLYEKMRTFSYDPSKSFRSWLKTVTKNSVTDFFRERLKQVHGFGDEAGYRVLQDLPDDQDGLFEVLAENFEQEIMEEAMARVRQRVTDQRWQAFVMTAMEGASGADVAKQLNMKVSNVFSTRSKVLRMIQDEVRRLEHGGV